MRNAKGQEVKARKTSNHHKFLVVVHTLESSYEDNVYLTKTLASKRVANIVNGVDDELKEFKKYIVEGFSYCEIIETFS